MLLFALNFLPAKNVQMKIFILISQTGMWGDWAIASCTCNPPEISVHQTQTFEHRINLVQLVGSLQNTVSNQLQ